MSAVLELQKMKFSLKLKQLLEKAGMTGAELSRRTGINHPTIRGYMAGTRKNPSGVNILLISQALGVSADVFLDCLDSLGPDDDAPKRKKKK